MKKIVLMILIMCLAMPLISCNRKHTENIENTENMENIETEVMSETDDYYSVCTSFPKQEVEVFADTIKECFAKEDWNTLSEIIIYPITINENYYENQSAFLSTDWSTVFSEEFKNSIIESNSTDMFCNWMGIMLEETGNIWFNEIEGKLVISAINYRDGLEKEVSPDICGNWELDAAKTGENLKNGITLQQMFGTGLAAGGTFILNQDGTFVYTIGISSDLEDNSGTFLREENTILLQFTDKSKGEITVRYETFDGKKQLISEDQDGDIYWYKLAE